MDSCFVQCFQKLAGPVLGHAHMLRSLSDAPSVDVEHGMRG